MCIPCGCRCWVDGTLGRFENAAFWFGFDDPFRPFPSFPFRLDAFAGVWEEASTFLDPSLGLEEEEE